MLLLVFADWHELTLVQQDVCSHEGGICQQARVDTLALLAGFLLQSDELDCDRAVVLAHHLLTKASGALLYAYGHNRKTTTSGAHSQHKCRAQQVAVRNVLVSVSHIYALRLMVPVGHLMLRLHEAVRYHVMVNEVCGTCSAHVLAEHTYDKAS